GRSGVTRVGRVAALELLVGRAGDHGRRGVHEDDVLDAGGGVAAAVGRGPGAVDPRYAGATGRRSCIGEGDRDRRGAVVGGSGRAGRTRVGWGAGLELRGGRAGDHGRGGGHGDGGL